MSYRNFQQYYYSDCYFQLELNLQEIRRALIYLLEEPDSSECFICNRLRCRCVDTFSSVRSTTLSDLGFSFSEISSSTSVATELDYIFITAPPAEALPMPVWQVSRSHRSSPDSEENSGGVGKTVGNTEESDDSLQENPGDIKQWSGVSCSYVDGKGLRFHIDESVNNEANCSWPAVPSSIWREPAPHIEFEMPVDSVDAFFRNYAEMSEKRGYSYF